jgi:hypothetical protein
VKEKEFRAAWVSMLWHTMWRTGKGYMRHSMRHTGKTDRDGTVDRRADKLEGPLARMPKWMRGYSQRYAVA